MSNATTTTRPQKARRRREPARVDQGPRSRPLRTGTAATPARKRTMDKMALTPLAKDAYSYGAEQGFRLGYLAAGEVVAEGIGVALPGTDHDEAQAAL